MSVVSGVRGLAGRWWGTGDSRSARAHPRPDGGLSSLSKLAVLAKLSSLPNRLLRPPSRAVPSWLELRRGEKVRWTVPSARLIELPEWNGLRAPGHLTDRHPSPSFAREMPCPSRIVDQGPVVITDQRVAFGGSCYRQDWLFSRLVGMAHDPETPCTVLRSTDRTKIAGLVVAAAAARVFRLKLTQAVATAIGDGSVHAAGIEPPRAPREPAHRPVPSHRRTTREWWTVPGAPRHRRVEVRS